MIGSINSAYVGLYNPYGVLQPTDLLRDSEIGRLRGQGNGLLAAGSNQSLNRAVDSTQVRLSDVGKLRSALDTFRTTLSSLSSLDSVAPLRATSSNENVARATASTAAKDSPAIELSVSQLATQQVLQSQPVSNADSTIVGSGTLKIEIGSTSSNGFSASSSSTVNITSGNGTLGGIAAAINNAKAGVTASVVTADDGSAKLQLTAARAGSNNTVRLTVSDNDGKNTDSSGLSQLAFDTTATAGNGRNLTETTAASNAQLTIDGRGFVSNGNTTGNAITGLTLELRGTGQTTLNVARDQKTFSQSAEQFVNAVNQLQQGTAALRDDSLINRSLTQLDTQLANATSGIGRNQLTLADIGITRNNNGQLTVDQNKLASTFAAAPEGAAKLLSDTASSLGSAIDRTLSPQGELSFASKSLERSLASLQTTRDILRTPDTQSYYGVPAQSLQSLFNYAPRQGSSAGISRYLAVSGV
ncbi:flagellar filament capping protein FliD [Chitinivorax sp. PXF-14]|uniref:flagellar filament capping protein FliD n=1 Tax=Chitinivorax sp. PXF-14 TaxID=3230488 RepID=UPI003465AE1B